MKRKILMLLVLLTIFIVGCSSISKNEEITLQKVDISYINNEEFLTTIKEVPLGKGIYLVEGLPDKYIILSKLDIKSDENISCKIDNPSLKIDISTEESSNMNAYRILNEHELNYDFVELMENNKKVTLSTIILSE